MIMKISNIIRSAAVSLALISMAAVSCGPEPKVVITPEFPEVVEKYDLAPGSTVTLTFEANMDWTVSVPVKTLKWF